MTTLMVAETTIFIPEMLGSQLDGILAFLDEQGLGIRMAEFYCLAHEARQFLGTKDSFTEAEIRAFVASLPICGPGTQWLLGRLGLADGIDFTKEVRAGSSWL